MKQEDMTKIEALRAQTFGVEIEMNHITRQAAAKVAAGYFGTNSWAHVGERYYDSWTAKDAQGRIWKFSRDGSICGPDSEKCELVTPILHYEDIEFLQELVRRLRDAGAVSNPKNGCGVHIHVGGDGHTPTSIRALCNMMAKYEKTLIQTVHIDDGRLSNYCQTVDPDFLRRLNEQKPKTMNELEDLWYQFNGGCDRMSERLAHYNPSRYHMLNLHSFFHGHGTIEFRLFQFDNPHRVAPGSNKYTSKQGLHAGHLKAMIQMCLAMNNLAKMTKFSRLDTCRDCAKKTDVMRWFYKLGFIGEEFTTCRRYFARNLEAGVAHHAHNAPAPATMPTFVPTNNATGPILMII